MLNVGRSHFLPRRTNVYPCSQSTTNSPHRAAPASPRLAGGLRLNPTPRARQTPSSFSRERPHPHSAPPPPPLAGEGRDEGRFAVLVGLASASEIPAAAQRPSTPGCVKRVAPASPQACR